MDEAETPFLITVERVLAAHAVMTADEKAAFEAWEALNVTGDGRFGTTDWPGWRGVFSRIAH
jgi:hypothetical protein